MLFFLVVRPYTKLSERFAKEDPTTKDCPECRSTIPISATRCAFCTTTV